MGCCQSGIGGNPPTLETLPLLDEEAKEIPSLKISEAKTHKLDSTTTNPTLVPSSSHPPRLNHNQSLQHGGSLHNIPSPRRTGHQPSLSLDASAGELKSPRGHQIIKRSLTMSANAATTAPLLDQVNQKFSRHITDLPVASDIPRMVSRTSVFDINSGKIVFNRSEGVVDSNDHQPPKQQPNLELSKYLILTLYQLSTPENKKQIANFCKEYDEQIPPGFDGDSRDIFNIFLDKSIGNEGPVAAILKCVNQGFVAPAIVALRIALMGKFNYKDCGNHWDVEIKAGSNAVLITHKKREQTIPVGCEFVWSLTAEILAPFNTVNSVEFSIISVNFVDENMDQERKNKIQDSLYQFFSTELKETSPNKPSVESSSSSFKKSPRSPRQRSDSKGSTNGLASSSSSQ